MNRPRKKISLSVWAVVFLFSGTAFAGIHPEAGTSAAGLLEFLPGARPAGIGGASATLDRDAFALCWNPASLSSIRENAFSFMYSFWVENASIAYLASVIPLEIGTAGYSCGYMSAGTIQKIDNTGTPLAADFTPFDLVLSGGYGIDIIGGLSAGGSIKLIHSSLDNINAYSFATDIGAAYRLLNDAVKIGLSLQNFGLPLKFTSGEHPLPLNIRLGTSYQWKNFLFFLDGVLPRDDYLSLHFGLEYTMQFFILRLGYNSSVASTGGLAGFSFGTGLDIFGKFTMDYAWVPFGELGNTQRISICTKF